MTKLKNIINEEINNITYNTFFHHTDAESAEGILSGGFNTPEVWVAPDDTNTEGYGDVGVLISAPEPKKPFIMDKYALNDYEYNLEVGLKLINKNKKLYEKLGGEANPETFNKLRKNGL